MGSKSYPFFMNLGQHIAQFLLEDENPKARLNESETATIGEFIKYACKNLEIQKVPHKLTLSYDTDAAKEKRSFGYFDPNSSKIWVYVKNRNMGDILRTLAHELVHHKQNEDGRISYESGKTGSDIENEANAKAGILLRDFGKQNNQIYQ
jgi:Zn-dependent peptidase ImmA (M78 family)